MVGKVRGPIEYNEFINLIKMVRNEERLPMVNCFEAICVLNLQWHLIARIHDLMKSKFDLYRMRWSKT